MLKAMLPEKDQDFDICRSMDFEATILPSVRFESRHQG